MRRFLSLVVTGLLLTPVGATAWVGPAPPEGVVAFQAVGLDVVEDLTGLLSAQDLADALLGSGVTISNVSYSGDDRAAGTFKDGIDDLGIDSGIVLSAGQVFDAEGPTNSAPNTSTNLAQPGDPDLDLITDPFLTFDAAVLEFDFESESNTVVFRYVFTSEEYNEFSNREFNNVFAFFVDGVNRALLPDTMTPVAINTVNGGNPNSCTDGLDNDLDTFVDIVDPDCHVGGDNFAGEDHQNPEFYINNDPHGPAHAAPATVIPIEPDGLTTVLEFIAEVTPGETHHMKLAIADSGDAVFDSWVFIETASFSSAITEEVEPGEDVEVPFDFDDASTVFEFEEVNEPFSLTVGQIPFDCDNPPRTDHFPGAVGIPFVPGSPPLCVLYRVFNPPDEGQIGGEVETKIAWFDPAPVNPRLLRSDDAESLFEDITTGYFPQAEPGEDPGLRGGSRGLSDFMPIDWLIEDLVSFNGFERPLGRGNLSIPAGVAVSVKFRLFDLLGRTPITSAIANISVTRIDPDTQGIDDVMGKDGRNVETLFTVTARDRYAYNLDTTGLPSGTYVVAVTTNPFVMSPKTVQFVIR